MQSAETNIVCACVGFHIFNTGCVFSFIFLMCIPFWMCNSGLYGVKMLQLWMHVCLCEKCQQRWRVLHVHWQLYRLCGSWGEQDYGKANTHTHRDLLTLVVDPHATVRWGPEFSAHFINRNKLVPSKHTYNLLKWKDEMLWGQEWLKGVKFAAVIIWVDTQLIRKGLRCVFVRDFLCAALQQSLFFGL